MKEKKQLTKTKTADQAEGNLSSVKLDQLKQT
jgi:hypothetical protein